MNVEVADRRIGVVVTKSLRTRFWGHVQTGEPDVCWPWIATVRRGYGVIKHQRRVHSSHRLAYILMHGEPAKGLVIGHKCGNRICCNPNHLEAITRAESNRRPREPKSSGGVA